jgi:two-component system sensor kinase FixL
MREKAILKAILANAPDAIIRIDENGTILGYLGAAESMFQYTPEEIEGQPVERLMPKLHADQHAAFVELFLSEMAQRGLPEHARRLEATKRDGTTFPVEIALSQIEDQGQTQFIGTIRDLSRRVSDEKRIRDVQKNLEAASRDGALAELAIQIAHELNQPLTAIANYMDALELKLERLQLVEVDDLVSLATRAGQQARSMGEIISRLKHTLTPSDFDAQTADFHDAVADAMAALVATFGSEDIEVTVEHLGEGSEVSFDRLQLHQVLANLVKNALTAVENANVKRLVVTSEVREGEAELRVADSGPGVPSDRKTEIFDSFVSDSLEGLGLGLAIANRIAKAHSGKLWVEDGPDGGAVFRMVLPLT